MKKIMFILAFVGIGLFASADNGKVKLPSKASKIVLKKSLKPSKEQWSYTTTCSNGNVYTGCCWSSSGAAYLHGLAAQALCLVP